MSNNKKRDIELFIVDVFVAIEKIKDNINLEEAIYVRLKSIKA